MINNKGFAGLGAMLILGITVIVAATLYTASIANVGQVISTSTFNNLSFLTTNSPGYDQLTGKAIIGNPLEVYNGTGKTFTEYKGCSAGAGGLANFSSAQCMINTGNFTITNYVTDTDGTLIAKYQVNANGFNGTVNISYNGEPDNYISDSTARSVSSAILPLMLALALVVAAIAGMNYKDLF